MDNILITFPRETVAESYEAAKKFVESINLEVGDLHINEDNWGIVVPSDTQSEFLEHAGNLGGKVFLLEESEKPKIEEKTWVEVSEAVQGARFEMNGSQPIGKQEGRVLPGRYYVMGMQESGGSMFVTLARVDNVAELGKRTGPGRYVYAVDADSLGEAMMCGYGDKMTDMPKMPKKAKKAKRGNMPDDEMIDDQGVDNTDDTMHSQDDAPITPHANMNGYGGFNKVESRQTRSDAILDMLLENDPGILAEKASAEKAEKARIALEEAAKAKEVVNENAEPSLEDLLRVSFNESARSEVARKAEKAGEEVAPAPVVEPQPEPEVLMEELPALEESIVAESFSGSDVLGSLLESVGEVEGQHADETSPDNWMVDDFGEGCGEGHPAPKAPKQELAVEQKDMGEFTQVCDDPKSNLEDDESDVKEEADKSKDDMPDFIKRKIADREAQKKGNMPSRDQIMKMCKDGKSDAEIMKACPGCPEDKVKGMIKSCREEMNEAMGDMPSKSQIMKMCKDGKSDAEIMKACPGCPEGEVKAMIKSCRAEMNEAMGDMPSMDDVMKMCKDGKSDAEIMKACPGCPEDKVKAMIKSCRDKMDEAMEGMPSMDDVMKMCKDGKSPEEIRKACPGCDMDKLNGMIKTCMSKMEEGYDPKGMPSKDHVMEMCKKGMSMGEMMKMHPEADEDKLKALVAACKAEMKESIEEGMDPAQFGAVRDVIAKLIEEGVDLENLSDEELAEAVDKKCDSILAEEEQTSEEPVLAEGEYFEDEGFEVVAEAEMAPEAQADEEEEGEEEEQAPATLKDVLQKKAAEMRDEEEDGDENDSEEVAKDEAVNRPQRRANVRAGRRAQQRAADDAHDAGHISDEDHDVTLAKTWRSGARQGRDAHGDIGGGSEYVIKTTTRDLATSRAAGGRTPTEIGAQSK